MRKKRIKKDKEISFLGRALLLARLYLEKLRKLHPFKKISERQKRLAGYDTDDASRESKISYGFGIARFYTVSVLCIFLAVVLIFGGNIFSYENVYYMFKDIEYINSFNEGRPQTLSYSKPLTNQSIGVYKDGLAVVSDSEFKFFTSTGRATLSIGSEYSNPKICTSNAYALIYDQGNRSFSVYNSFVCLYSEKLDYPISSAHMSGDGSFCIVTKTKDYGSAVRIYNSRFELESEYLKNDYVVSAKLSQDGEYLFVASLDTEDGASKTTVTLLQTGKNEMRFSTSVNGKMPYDVTFLGGDRIALFCDTAAYVYDLKGNQKSHYEYPHNLTHISVDKDGFALVFDATASSGGYILSVFDKNGLNERTYNIDIGIHDIDYSNGNVYLLCDREIRRLSVKSVTGEYDSVGFTGEDATLVVFSTGDVLACTPAVAYYISFN